jgi:hypothetical protein
MTDRPCGHAALYRPPQVDASVVAELKQQVSELTEELKQANTLLGDAGFYIRRMAKIIEGYNHPSRIHARALEWLRTKWKAVNLFTRWDREGRDVTNLPGLWSDEDVQVSATNFAHPTITSGQHTNGPAIIWLKRCVDGAEWVNTGLTHMHKVRDAWVVANQDGAPNPQSQYGEIR